MNEHELYKDAILSNIANKERIRKNVLHEKSVHRRWPLAAAACLCAALAATMLVPSARAAVGAWFNTLFTPKQYIETPKDERTPIPALEEAVTPVEPQAQPTVKVTYVKEGWEQFAENLEFTFDEIFYDGQQIIVTGEVRGDSQYLLAQYMPTGISALDFQTDVSFMLGGGQEAGRGSFEPVFPQEVKDILYNLTEETDGPVEALQPFVAQNRYRFSTSGWCEELEGVQSLSLKMTMGPLVVTGYEDGGTYYDMDTAVTVEVTGLQFDATAAKAGNVLLQTPAEIPIVDANVSLLVIDPLPKGAKKTTMRNVSKSLSGGKFAVESIERRITGVDITFSVTLPESWTAEEVKMFASTLEPILFVNGTNIGGFRDRAYNSIGAKESDNKLKLRMMLGDVRILPGDWESIETLALQLAYRRTDKYNGVELPDGVDAAVPYDGKGWEEDASTVELPVIISIPLPGK